MISTVFTEFNRVRPTESIGACASLCVLLDPESAYAAQLVDDVLVQSGSFRSCLLRMLGSYFSQKNRPKLFVLSLVIKMLSHKGWLEIDFGAINSAYQIMSCNYDAVAEACRLSGIPDGISVLAASILNSDRLFDETKGELKPERDYGILMYLCGPPSALYGEEFDSEALDKIASLGGVFSASAAAAAFVKRPSQELSNQLSDQLGNNVRNLNWLPIEARTLFNNSVIDLSCRSLTQAISSDARSGVRHLTFRESSEQQNWVSLLRDQPQLAFSFLGSHFGYFRRNSQDRVLSDEIIQEVLAIGDKLPNLLQENIDVWPFLLSFSSGSGTRVRQLMSSVARQIVTPNTLFVHETLPALRFPEEAFILTRLLAALILSVEGISFTSIYSDISFDGYRQIITDRVVDMAPSPHELVSLIEDPEMPKRERAAALVALRLHTKGGEITKTLPSFLDLWEAKEALWFLPAVSLCLSDGVERNQDNDLRTIGKLFALSRDNYIARLTLDNLLQAWREFSRAPVKLSMISGEMAIWQQHEVTS